MYYTARNCLTPSKHYIGERTHMALTEIPKKILFDIFGRNAWFITTKNTRADIFFGKKLLVGKQSKKIDIFDNKQQWWRCPK